MNCKECREELGVGAKFCPNCGAQVLSPHETIQCHDCGFENTMESRFCAECGAPLVSEKQPAAQHKKHKARKEKQKQEKAPSWSSQAMKVIGLAGGIVLVALFFSRNNNPASSRQNYPIAETRNTDPAVELRVRTVASEFICSCGSCNEQPLETCTCATAAEERQFIRDEIAKGESNDRIITMVNKRYGWMKKGRGGKAEAGSKESPGVATSATSGNFGKRAINVGIATVFDKNEILSHFRCPCGQCQIDELLRCDCTHPRGATEIKRFVDDRIAEHKFSKQELIAEVESAYGGQKY